MVLLSTSSAIRRALQPPDIRSEMGSEARNPVRAGYPPLVGEQRQLLAAAVTCWPTRNLRCRVQGSCDPRNDLRLTSRITNLMFPDPHDPPVNALEKTVHFTVSSNISLDLQVPVFLSTCWPPVMPSTTVPETAVYEHCKSCIAKHEIRATRQYSNVSTNVTNAREAQQSFDPAFRLRSTTADACHNARSCLDRDTVHRTRTPAKGSDLDKSVWSSQFAVRPSKKQHRAWRLFDAAIGRDGGLWRT